MLFTGDIEQIAEEKIIAKYSKKQLKSTIVKVAHHGSKTSSIQEFVDYTKPKTVLIGVGEKNTFGHPNSDVIKRFEKIGAKVYRTDKMGEICIIVLANKNKYNIKITSFLIN